MVVVVGQGTVGGNEGSGVNNKLAISDVEDAEGGVVEEERLRMRGLTGELEGREGGTVWANAEWERDVNLVAVAWTTIDGVRQGKRGGC